MRVEAVVRGCGERANVDMSERRVGARHNGIVAEGGKYDRAAASDEGDLGADQLVRICEVLVAAWELDSAESGNGAVAGSAAALDVASVREVFPQDMPTNVEHAHGQMAGDMINAVVLLLRSIVTLLRAEPLITLGIWPLVRAELEYAGRITWLLEPLSGGDAGRRRVARGMLEHLSAVQRQRFTAGKWNPAQAAKFKKVRTEIRSRVTALFEDVHTPLDAPEKIAEWTIGGEKMVMLGEGVDRFLTLNLTNGKALYDVLSDNSHPSVISLALQSFTTVHEGVRITTYPPIPRVLNMQVRLGCLTLYRSAITILDYFGHPHPALDLWAAHAPDRWFPAQPSTPPPA